MKIIATIFALILAMSVSTQTLAESTADNALDALHKAGAEADQARFLSLLTPEAVFMGLPGSSRLQGQALRDFIYKRFTQEHTWLYRSSNRQTHFSADGTVAWFDESLDNEQLGHGRGSGVLLLEGGNWKVAQYNISVPAADNLTMTTSLSPLAGAAVETPASDDNANDSTSENAATIEPEKKKTCRKFRHKTNKQSRC